MSLSFLLANWKPIAFALAFVIGIGIGWTVNGWKHEAERAKALDDLIAEQEANYRRAVNEEAARLSRQRENEAQTETVIQEVIRYVEADSDRCGIGAASARALNRLRK